MKSYDFDAVVYIGEVYCVDCLPDGVDLEDPEVSPIFAGSECDSFLVCCECSTIHDYFSIIEESAQEMVQ